MGRLTTLKPRISILGQKPSAQRRDAPWSTADRRKTTARGLGWRWQQLRLQVLRRDCYLCQCPDCMGGEKRVTVADEVDHIKPRAWFLDGRETGDPDDPSNLRAVSRECHRRITLEQQGRRPRGKIETGQDGWPVKR
jgi:5-methylcytosine-specific restriction enzyme A